MQLDQGLRSAAARWQRKLVSTCSFGTTGRSHKRHCCACLKKGEILPDVDVEEEVELTSQEKLDNMLTEMVPGEAAAPSDAEGREQRDSNIREAICC